MRIVLAFCAAFTATAMAASQATQATFRVRPATDPELKAVSSRTGAGLVVEAVPASVADLETGDLLAFADTTVLVSLDSLLQAIDLAKGKPIDLLFYRGKTARLATVVLEPAMFGRPEKGVDPPKPRDDTEGERPPGEEEFDVNPGRKKPEAPTTPPPPPLGPGRTKVPAAKFVASEWTIDPSTATDAFPPDGGLRLGRGGREATRARTAARREKLRGDFELTVEYEMLDWQPATMISTGFGIRFESPSGWEGERLVSFDRIAGRGLDEVVAIAEGPTSTQLTAQASGTRGALRVRRTGDAWRFFQRGSENVPGAWTALGVIPARLPPDVELWLTTHAVGKGETKVLVREITFAKPDGRK